MGGRSILGIGARRRLTLGVACVGVGVITIASAMGSVPSPGAPTPATRCTVPAGSWPMYQGTPTHTADACSTITAANVDQLRPAWLFRTPGAVTATPVVAFGSVFAGDYDGNFYALTESSGALRWQFQPLAAQGCFLDAPDPHADRHGSGFGAMPGSAATAVIDGRPTVYLPAGGSLFALDATTGRCLWAQDTDPADPTSSAEIESSPVVDTAVTPPEVIVGNDDNSSPGVAVTGVMAFDAQTGALLWKYEPERDLTLTPAEFGGSDALTLSCGDGDGDTRYCTSANIRDLPPDSKTYADACGDVWSSPALDTFFADPAGDNTFQGSGDQPPAGWYAKQITGTGRANDPAHPDGLVVFGTGNCSAHTTPATALAHGDYVDNEGVFALDPVTGVRVWDFVEPYNIYDNNPNEPMGGDDDFGSSAVIANLPASSVHRTSCAPSAPGLTTLVIEGSKDGTAYGLCARNGAKLWSVQAAQPGQASADLVGAIGGFLGSPALGMSNGRPTVFFTSAVPTPLSNDGLREPGDGDHNLKTCPGVSAGPVPPACPDLSLLTGPQRLVSLHAIDAATGTIVFQAPSLPTYAAATYTGGVVFLPDSLAFAVGAFDATTGHPLWAFPLGGVPASGAAIAGGSIFLGSGETDSTVNGSSVPPQVTGIWKFSLGSV